MRFWFLSVFYSVLVLGNRSMMIDEHVYDQLEEDVCMDRDYKCEHPENSNTKCIMPMNTLIKLKPSLPNVNVLDFLPKTVIVKRCGDSSCPYNFTCFPESFEMVKQPVELYLDRETKCGYVNIMQHKTCKCGCALTKESCSSSQTFWPTKCICRCKDQAAKIRCSGENIWDERTCSCSCGTRIKECTSGFGWDFKMCKCVRSG